MDPPPTILEDPAFAAAAATSGQAQQIAAPFAAEDTADATAAAERAQQVAAAYASTGPHWKDIPLAPFAISREGDWLLHRTALGCAPLEQLILQPQAMLSDALRVLWFLAHDPSDWLSIPAMSEVEGRWQMRSAHDRALELEATIRDWADEHVESGEHTLAVRLFYNLYNGARETRTAIKPSKHHDAVKAGN